jgi:hypothetical protein
MSAWSYLPICHYQIRVSPKYHHKNGFRCYAIFNHCSTDKMPFYPFSTLRETFILGKITTLSSHRESSHFDQPPAPLSPCPAAAPCPAPAQVLPPPAARPSRPRPRRRLGHPGLAVAGAQASSPPPPRPRHQHCLGFQVRDAAQGLQSAPPPKPIEAAPSPKAIQVSSFWWISYHDIDATLDSTLIDVLL